MKSIVPLISVFVFVLLFIKCDNESNSSTGITGKLISQSICKYDMKSANNQTDYADTLSCIEYVYNKTDCSLFIKHINSGFNCCPGEISCHVFLANDSIFIQEDESNTGCKCDCLFDLELEVTGLSSTADYHLVFIEPYIGTQDKLIFEIHLADTNQGSFCVTRKKYPWGILSSQE